MTGAPAGPDWGAEPAPPTPGPASGGDLDDARRQWVAAAGRVGAGDEPVAAFPNFESWVVEWLTPTIRRPLRGGVLWCPEWWRHDEACVRLDALWRAWETARVEGGSAMSYWWDMHLDAHWAVLSSDQGPFGACKDQVHSDRLGPLPLTMPPADWTFLHSIDGGDQR